MGTHKWRRCLMLSAAVMAAAALACSGCVQCDLPPHEAVLTLGGYDVLFELQDNETILAGKKFTYSMAMFSPDEEVRWKTADSNFGTLSILCLQSIWSVLFGNDDVPVVFWLGGFGGLGGEGGSYMCAKIRSLTLNALGAITATVEIESTEDTMLAYADSAVIALNKPWCPRGECGGILIKDYCVEPYASLDNASLSYSHLNGADLNFAILTNAHFRDSSLKGADLGWADLTGADLRGLNLTDAKVYETVAPDGVIVNSVSGLQDHQVIK